MAASPEQSQSINTDMLSRILRSYICRDCLAASSRRCFSSSASATSILPSPPPPTGYAHLTNRALILLYGHDAAHYLQGLTTTNIKKYTLNLLGGFYTCFLNAQGRVLYDVFVYPIDHGVGFGEIPEEISCDAPGFMIDVDQANAEALRLHLKRYKLRAKIALQVVDPGEWRIFGTWNDEAVEVFKNTTTSPQNFGCIDTRAPGMGKRILSFADISKTLQGEETSVESYDVRRILKGVPQGHDEIILGEALPQESNIDYMSGIDFRKGCYVGQELTIRTHHTGVVRKRILPVQLYNPDEKPPDDLQYDFSSSLTLPHAPQNIARVNTRGRSAGKFLKGVGNVGLALCRLETMTNLKLTEEASQWSPEHEFKMTWQSGEDQDGEKEVKIKAFVPEWHRYRIGVRDVQ
ncbi:MAG: hypothetical protein Q9209_003387 [Squamulea sp. 1 TL-2023]